MVPAAGAKIAPLSGKTKYPSPIIFCENTGSLDALIDFVVPVATAYKGVSIVVADEFAAVSFAAVSLVSFGCDCTEVTVAADFASSASLSLTASKRSFGIPKK